MKSVKFALALFALSFLLQASSCCGGDGRAKMYEVYDVDATDHYCACINYI